MSAAWGATAEALARGSRRMAAEGCRDDFVVKERACGALYLKCTVSMDLTHRYVTVARMHTQFIREGIVSWKELNESNLLTTEDKRGCLPLFFATWGNAPEEIIFHY